MTTSVGLIIVAVLAACTGDSSTPTPSSPPIMSPSLTDQPVVTDLDSFVEGLGLAGHDVEVERHEDPTNDIFGVRGYAVSFDRTRLMAFDYSSERAAKRLQESVSRDGYYIGDYVIDWGGQHLYRSGSVVVVYLGERPGSLSTLEELLGRQFAPR
jgi:hypothetical protein